MKAEGKGKVSGTPAYNLARKLISRLSDTYGQARHFQFTHDEIVELVRDKVKNDQFARLPAYWQGYIEGMYECQRDRLFRECLMWMLSCDGRLMTSKEVDALTELEVQAKLHLDPEYRSPWSRIDSGLSRHVWVDKEGNPLREKPFERKFKKETP